MRHLRDSIGIGAALACLVSNSVAQQQLKGRVFTDKTQGYKLTMPNEWSPRPIHMDATRLVGWFHSHKHFPGDPKKGDSKKWHRATLCVVRLDKPAEGKKVHDYPARMRRQLKADTYKPVSRVEDGVTIWDIDVKGKGVDRVRIRTWVLPRQDHDLALEFRIGTDHFAGYEAVFKRVRGSLELFAPTPRSKKDPLLSRQFELRPWLAKSVLDRHRERAALGAAYERYVESRLPAGWTVHRSKHVMLVSDCEPKKVKKAHKWIGLFVDWLDDRFAGLSTDYPIRMVIRLCKNSTEYHSYRSSGGWRVDYNFADREIVMCDDRGNFNMKDVLWAVYRRYMLDRAPEVYFNTPTWLKEGLRGLISRAYIRRGKLAFPPSSDELALFDKIRRDDRKPKSVRDLMDDPTFGYIYDKQKMSYELQLQARILLRFFDGPGKRCKAVRKDFLLRYFTAIRDLAREIDFADPKVMVWDSEDAIRARLEKASTDGKKVYVPSYANRWSAYTKLTWNRKKEFTKQLHARVRNWSKSEWSQVDRAFDRFAKSKLR